MTEQLQETITDERAWDRSSFDDPAKYTFTLKPESIDELKKNRGLFTEPITAQGGFEIDESLFPNLKADAEQYRNNYLEGGSGIGIISGITPEEFTRLEQQNIYWMMCKFLGTPLVQNHVGDFFITVENRGKSMKTGGRYHDTKEGGNMHSDSPQYATPPNYLGLLCYHPAKEGGRGILTSVYTVHNQLLKENPDLLDEL